MKWGHDTIFGIIKMMEKDLTAPSYLNVHSINAEQS